MGFRHKIQPMSYRAAILISCLKGEADYIREQARADSRSISNYMLKVLLRWVESEERFAARHVRSSPCLSQAVVAQIRGRPLVRAKYHGTGEDDCKDSHHRVHGVGVACCQRKTECRSPSNMGGV